MAEWSKAADCKSVAIMLHRFESYSLYNYIYKLRKMIVKKQISKLNNIYSSILSINPFSDVKKNMSLQFSYVIFFKRIYFVRLSGSILRNCRKQHSINQTLTIAVSLKRDNLIVNVPVQTKAVVIF